MKKTILAFGTITLLTCALAFTSYANEKNSCYIESPPVSVAAQDMAKEQFEGIDSFIMDALEIQGEMTNLRLSTGFRVYSLNHPEREMYYFPIFDGDTMVAVIATSSANGTDWSSTLNSNFISVGLNSLNSTKDDPAKILLTGKAVYAVKDNETVLLAEVSNITDADRQNDAARIQVEMLSEEPDAQSIVLDSANVFDIQLQAPMDARYTKVGRSCDGLQRIPNDPNCAAVCCGMYIEYFKNGSSYSTVNARAYAQEVYSKYATTMLGSKKAVNAYTGRSLTDQNSMINWDQLKSSILNSNSPVFMHLQDGSLSHQALIVGYNYDMNNPNAASRHDMLVCDPNVPNWQEVLFSNTYDDTIGQVYTWDASLFM